MPCPSSKLSPTLSVQGITGVGFFFLRANTEKAVAINNIATDVNFGSMDCSNGKLLEGIERVMNKIMMPALKNQEVLNFKIFIN